MANKNKKRHIFIKLSFLFIIIITGFVFSIFIYKSFILKNQTNSDFTIPVNTSINDNYDNNTLQSDTTIKMSIIGDIMCHNSQYKDAYKSSNNTYDFSYVFTDIRDHLLNSDICIGNLETTFAGSKRGYSSYPTFNTPESLSKDLKELGIDILSTANNHSLDSGYSGVVSTLDYLDSTGILHTGTARSYEEQSTILTQEVNGIKIAFLSYTYGTNGIPIPSGKEYCVNLIDKNLMYNQIQQAKNLNVDLICANMHWGTEYRQTPTSEQESLANFLFENGVDIILGSHPHVLEPMDKRKITTKDGISKEVFVIYSLGNFMSGQTKENTRNSIILDLEITKHKKGNITIDTVSYTPIYCYTSNGKFKGYKILDIKKSINDYENGTSRTIGSNTYSLLKNELKKVNSILGNCF